MILKNRTIRDMAPHFGTCAVYQIYAVITTLFAKLLVLLWGIKLGRDCSFRGLPLLRRMPNSKLHNPARSTLYIKLQKRI